jgi:hypothetical protein
MNTDLTGVTAQQLRRAAVLKETIESLEAELSRLLSGGSTGSRQGGTGPRRMSAAARAKIRASQKARWAAIRGGQAKPGPRRRMSAASRARLAAIARARWKKAKSSGRNAL